MAHNRSEGDDGRVRGGDGYRAPGRGGLRRRGGCRQVSAVDSGVVGGAADQRGAFGVGATMVYVGTFLGRRYESPVACTGFAENKQLATATTGGPFHLEVDQTLEPAGAGTKLTVRCRADSREFFKLVEPLVIRLAKKQIETRGGEPQGPPGRARALAKHSGGLRERSQRGCDGRTCPLV
jgi:hypothetical protein